MNRERTETSLDATGRSRATDALRRGAFFALAVVLGFLLLELPWNDGVFAIPQRYVVDNLLILGLGCAIVFLAGQRTRASLAVFTGFCLLWGTANFFIITFKGQPIVPADLFALGTAASVAGGYSLFLTGRLMFCWALFAAYCIALAKLCPQRKRVRWDIAANMLAAALLVCLGAMQYQAIDIKSDCDVTVDVWDVRGSYATQGTALCFLSRAQELTPKPPEGYSAEAVDAILAPYAEDPLTGTDGTVAESPSPDTTGNQNSAAPTTGDAAPEQPEALPYDGPNVIAIMNETFSDLSEYPGLEGTNAAPTFFHEVADDSLAAGDVYVSAMGGGTCNSEFEFLTGASMGNMGGGVYPYVLYDLEGVDNLASYFRGLGYGTHAIHPAEAAIRRSDEDLRWLVDELNARNEPTIVAFFGDHQPGFADWLFEETFGKPVESASLEEVQARYRTPYFIWANAAARGKYGGTLARIENADVTSLNYLSSLLLDATGLPRDSRALYRSALRQALPAVNLNGYRDAEGTWHWFGEAVETDAQQKAEDALKSYAIVQYDQLFKDRSNR